MTPKQMKLLADRLDHFALGSGDIGTAADLIRQMAESPAPQTDDTALLRQALDALEESVDVVRHEYEADWRHGMPTREGQLANMRDSLDAHEAAIAAIHARLDGARKGEE
jgi:phage shock protein A